MQVVTRGLPIQDFPPDPDGTAAYYQTPRAEVPEVVGLEIEEAEELLLKAGFKVNITLVNSDEDEDVVVATDPEEGESLRQGSTVEVEVSNGLAPETILPDLIGRTRDEARDTLVDLRRETEIEFTWEFVNVDTTDPALRNTVISTSPSPGSTITEETVVILRIYHLVAGEGGEDGGGPDA